MSDQASVVIEREFEATAEKLWEMWTIPSHFEAWYGPGGATITVKAMDIEVGGQRHVGMSMETPNGPMQMWFAGEHQVVEAAKKLSYTESMADEAANILSAEETGMGPMHPGTTVVTVELTSDGPNTKMVLTHEGVPAGSPGEQGWKMALDKLADYLLSS